LACPHDDMNFILEPAVPAGRRVLMAHRMIRLDDGHNVGISLAGRGVPLVFSMAWR
jgi:hypothetical protein